LLQHLVDRRQDGLGLERWFAGEQLIEDRSQAVDIGRGGDRPVALGLLRGEVAGCADDPRGQDSASTRVEPLGEAKVGDVRLPDSSSRMLDGLRSRWRMPRWCA
jgi:hypothetical protein